MRCISYGWLLAMGLLSLPVQAHWQAVMVSGDSSIENFDNSRLVLGDMLKDRGLLQQQHLTSQFPDPVLNSTNSAHLYGIAKSFTRLKTQAGGVTPSCLFYISSHGQQNQGVYLERADSQTLTPSQLNMALNWHCGREPTVVLVSACYSGQFIPALKGPNRIIMTAAAANRPSFGCSEDTTYTFWDGCVIEKLPSSATWQQLSTQVNQCITQKEKDLGYPASLPQAFFGEKVKDLAIRF